MEENKIEVERKHISKGPFLGMRHVQVALLFFNFVVLYINRIHVALTLVAMTNADKGDTSFPKYNWNEQQKSYILSSFYWGYVLTQFPGAYFARRFGVKNFFLINVMSAGLFTLLVPFCLPWGGWKVFCLLRFLQGLFQGGYYPAMLQHLAKWSPPAERNMFAGVSHTGYDCGIVAAMALSGVIATTALGWPGTFYIYAALCFIWCALWQLFGADDATKSSFISKNERFYIEDSLKDSVSFEKKRLPVPWRAICRSKPFYALVTSRTVSLACLVIIQAEWPSYMNGVLKLDIKTNAFYSALPFVGSWFATYFFTYAANLITKRNLMSLSSARKFFDAIGMWLPAICVVIIGFLNETHTNLAIIIMIFVVAFHSSQIMGSTICTIEMAPNHAEIISSITSTISNIMVLLGPLLVGVIVENEQNRGQWRIVFITIAVVLCLGDLVFLIWGTAEEQPWNAVDYVHAKTKTQANEMIETSSDCKNV